MNAPHGILLVTPDLQIVNAVTDVIQAGDFATMRGVHESLDALLPVIDRVQPAAVLVDIDVKSEHVLRQLEPIIASHPMTRFIVISSNHQNELMLQAMQAGARHFMIKSDIPLELSLVLRRLVGTTAARKTRLGTVVTVLSTGGGCGATMLAINLADELESIASQPTLLVDLDRDHGSIAGYLGLSAEYGIADVLSDGSRIDGQLVRSTAVMFDERLHLLASPATVDSNNGRADVAFENLSRVLQACRETYAFTVVDAPRLPTDVAATLARASAATFLPFEMNVEDIRLTRVLHRALIERNVPAEHIYPIANRHRSKHEMITLDEARQAIGCANLDRLCNDYKAAVSSINLGKTLSESAPRSTLRAEIKALANRIKTEAEHSNPVYAE